MSGLLKPYPYQEWGIKRTLELKRLIIGDDMGLGKSATSIVAVARAKATPCLIICPSALKINWERETKKFTNLRPLILTDAVKSTFPYYIGQLGLYDVVITNYESLRKYFVVQAPRGCKLKDVVFQNVISQFKSVIIDESHRVKNPSSAQSKFTMGICQGKDYVIALSGTPVVNDPMDLGTQLCIIGRIADFGGYRHFLLQWGNKDNLDSLGEKLRETCYFRREKREVLTELPELTRTEVTCELSNRDEYELCQRDLLSYLREYKGLTNAEARRKLRLKALVVFMNLRKIAAMGKIDSAVQFLRDMEGQSVTVFCEHHEVVDALLEKFPDAVCVTGRQSSLQKQAAVDAFQSGERKIIICSIRSAGVGLTLTAGSNELFCELPWTFADLSQCEARQHRNGQKSAVNSWILLADNSIDARLYGLIMDKRSVASRITGAADDAIKDEKYFDELADSLLGEQTTENYATINPGQSESHQRDREIQGTQRQGVHQTAGIH